MRGEEKRGNKNVEDVEKLRARVAKLEQFRSNLKEHTNFDGQLDEAWHEWERTFDATKDSIMLINGEFKIIQANRATSHFLGMPLDEIVGSTCWQVVHGKESPQDKCPLKKAISSKKHEQVELHIPEKDIWVEVATDPILDDQGNVNRAVHIIRDITERKKAEEKIKIFLSGIENAYDGVAFTEMNGDVIYANGAAANIFGYSLAEMMKLNIAVFSAYQEEAKNLEKAVAEQGKWRGEITGIRKNKEKFTAILSVSVVKNEEGKPIGRMGIFRDITERKKVENAFRESERRFRTLFESTHEGLLTAAPDGRVVNANPAAARILGYKSTRDLIGMCTSDFYADQEQRKGILQELEKKGYIHDFEITAKKKDGTYAYLLASITIQRDREGNITRTDGIFRDITERKKAELSLIKERDKAQKYLDVADVMLVAVDSEERVGLINKKGCEILGYKEEEILGKNWFSNFLPERIRDEVREILQKLVRGEPDLRTNRENPVLTKSGEEKLIDWHNTILRDENGTFLATLSSGQDITEQKKTKEQIVKLARFPAENPNPILRISSDGAVIYANNSSSSLLKAWGCGVGHSLPSRWKKIALNALNTGQNQEIEVECEDRKFSLTFTPVMDYSYINVYGLDITERKKAEEALRQEHNLLRLLIDNIPDRIYVKDNEHRFLLGNEMVVRCEEFQNEDELIGKTDFDLYPKELAEIFYTEEQEVIQKNQPVINREGLYPNRQGNEEWTLITKVPLRDESGNTIGIVGINRDITERKKAEKALRQSEEKYRGLIEKEKDIIYTLDDKGNITFASPAVETILGYRPEELTGRNFMTLIPEEWREKTKADFNNLLKVGEITTETVLLDKKRQPHFVEYSSTTIKENGKVVGTRGISRDITDRKKAEKALRRSEHYLRKAQQIAHLGSWVFDVKSKRIEFSDEMFNILGVTKEEFDGSPEFAFKLVTPECRAEVQKNYEDLFVRHKSTSMEYSIVRPDGSVRHLWGNGEVGYDEEGNLQTLVGSVLDITERKKAEKSLQESEERFRRIFEGAHEGLIYIDITGRILDANPKAVELFAGPKEELVGKHFTKVGVLSLKDIPSLLKAFAKAVAGRNVFMEVSVTNRKGRKLTLECSTAVVKDKKRRVGIVVMVHDITERKKAREKIVRLARFPAENPSPVLRISNDGVIIYANNASSLLLKTWKCGVGYSLPEHWKKIALDALSSGQNQEIEVKCESRIFSLIFTPVTDYNYINAYGLDITERKRVEESLRVSESQLSEGAKIAKLGYWEHDVLNELFTFSDHFYEILHTTADKVGGYKMSCNQYFETFIHPDDRERVKAKCHDIFENPDSQSSKYLEHRIIYADGGIGHIAVRFSIITDDQGRVIKTYGVNQDITERKQVEQERLANVHFLESMDRVNRAIQGTSDLEQMMGDVLDEVLSIFNCDRAWLVYPCDPEAASWCAPMERTRPEYPGALALGLEVPIDSDVVRVYRTVLASEGPVQFHSRSEHALPAAVAEKFNEQSQIAMAIYPKGNKPYMFGLHQCSYPRVWTPQEERLLQEIGRRLTDGLTSLLMYRDLKERENQYRELANSITDIFFAMDTELRYTYWNKTSEKLTGIKAEDAIGKTIFEVFQDTEDTRKAAAVYQDVLKKKKPKSFENEYRLKDKHYFFEINAYPSEDGISVFAKDITERRKAEDALRTSEARLSDAIKIAKIGYWEYDVANDLFTFNDQFYSVYRTSAEKVGGYKMSPARYAEIFLHPEDVSDLQDEIQRAVETADPNFCSQVEHRFIYGDGEIGYVSVRYFVEKDYKGQTIKTYGANQDITERKRAEEAMRIAEERFSKAFHASPNAMTISRMEDGTLFEVNDMWENILGYSRAESVGITSVELGIWNEPSVRRKAVQQLQETGSIRNFETDLRCKTGDIRQVSLSSEHLEIRGEQCLLTVIHDITERRKAEESLRKSEEHYRMLAESMNDGLTRIDGNGIKIYVNQKCAEMFGYSPEEMLGKHWSNFYDKETQKVIKEQLAKRKKGIAEPYEVIGTRKNGSTMYLRISPQPLFDDNGNYRGSISILTDISERKRAEREKQLSRTILEISSKHRENGPLLQDIVAEIQKYSDCEAVGLRILDEEGNIPYEAYIGFSKKFYESESPLSIKSNKCMCINVIKGDTNPELPFYTDGGSFYMNGTTRFLATVSEQDKGSTRNVCNEFGYESVALIPIFLENRIHGLIHLADTRENMVPLDLILILERIAKQLGSAIQRVLAEEALMESEERYRDLFNHISSGVAVYEAIGNGKDFIFKDLNRSGEKIDNVKKEQLLGKSVTEVFPNIKRFGLFDVFQSVWKTGKAEHYPVSFYHDERIKGWRDNYVYKLPSGEIVAVYDDVTDRRKAENQLIEDQIKLKAMASKILLTEERERRSLAIGLHDNVSQKLVFAKLALESSLRSISDSKVLSSLKNACENIGETIQDAESLTFELSNPVLREFGFIAALEKYLNEEIRRKHGIEYELEKGKRIGSLQDEIKTCLFRVTRELLTNVVKHAQAEKIKISVRRSRGQLNVSIRDDGVGFDTTDSEEVSKSRFGLFSVREQLEYIGGVLEIESEPGQGTAVEVIVPLRKKSSNLNSRGK